MATWAEIVKAAEGFGWKVVQGRLYPFPHTYVLASGARVAFQSSALVLVSTQSQTPRTQGWESSALSANVQH